MNVENLRENYPMLLDYLKENGFSKSRISLYGTVIRYVLSFAENDEVDSYEKLAQVMADSHSVTTIHTCNPIVWAVRDYDLYGRFPAPNANPPLSKRAYYSSIYYEEFHSVIDAFKTYARQKGMKENSVKSFVGHCNVFFEFLASRGCKDLASIQESDVQSFFHDGEHQIRSHQYMYHVKYVLRENRNERLADQCNRIISFLPRIPMREVVYPFLSKEELCKIKYALSKLSTSISLREKAIVTTALYTGLRSCDISGLSIDSIDFQSETISIQQRKTSTPLVLPLRPVVGNAIFDYVTTERSVKSGKYLFVNNESMGKPMSPAEIGCVVRGFMIKAGVRVEKGNKGSHLFRHNVAVTLLQSGVSNPIISEVLGHTYAKSIEPYLGTDMKQLSLCAISIDDFPVRKEVLCK